MHPRSVLQLESISAVEGAVRKVRDCLEIKCKSLLCVKVLQFLPFRRSRVFARDVFTDLSDTIFDIKFEHLKCIDLFDFIYKNS